MASFIILALDSSERSKAKLIRASKSIAEGTIDETKNQYHCLGAPENASFLGNDNAAAGRIPAEIMNEAMNPCQRI
jgi:hypothetical protein